MADVYSGSEGHEVPPAAQINASNFNKLEVAWRFKTDNFGTRPEYKLEGTPLMVNGVIYATAGTRRAVVALDAKTGEMHLDPQHARRHSARPSRRGSFPAAASPTGATARATTASST